MQSYHHLKTQHWQVIKNILFEIGFLHHRNSVYLLRSSLFKRLNNLYFNMCVTLHVHQLQNRTECDVMTTACRAQQALICHASIMLPFFCLSLKNRPVQFLLLSCRQHCKYFIQMFATLILFQIHVQYILHRS